MGNASNLIKRQIQDDATKQSALRFNYAMEFVAPALAKAFGPSRIWLFGSASRNMALHHSDIDILVEGGGSLGTKERLNIAYNVISSLENLLCGIDVIVLTEEEIEQKKSVSAIKSMLRDRKLIHNGKP